MTRVRLLVSVGVLAAGPCLSCYDDIKVVQGTVIDTNLSGHTVTVRDERVPHATALYRINAEPSARQGDLVRIAFRETDNQRVTVRLMNLTRSEELKNKH